MILLVHGQYHSNFETLKKVAMILLVHEQYHSDFLLTFKLEKVATKLFVYVRLFGGHSFGLTKSR